MLVIFVYVCQVFWLNANSHFTYSLVLLIHVIVCLRIQNMKIIDGKPEYKGALVSIS